MQRLTGKTTGKTTGRITEEPIERLTPAEELEIYSHLSVEYLLVYLRFKKNASRELLLLFLRKSPNKVARDELLAGILRGDLALVANVLTASPDRTLLPTAPYYDQIIDAFMEESDEPLATNLLRYLLFFNMEKAHKTAIPYLIERYRAAPQSAREHIISPYCYNATTIFLIPSEIE